MSDPAGNNQEERGARISKGLLVTIAVIATVLLLAWAIATVFEVHLVKAFAMVILVVFGVIIALLVAGVA